MGRLEAAFLLWDRNRGNKGARQQACEVTFGQGVAWERETLRHRSGQALHPSEKDLSPGTPDPGHPDQCSSPVMGMRATCPTRPLIARILPLRSPQGQER